MGLSPDRSALVRVRAGLCVRRRHGASSQLPRRQDPTARDHGERDRRGLAVLAAAKTEQRLKREAEERRREEERRRRELAERAKHIEDRRIAGLGAILAELDELDRLRRLIAMLTTDVPAESAPRLSTFLSWARDHLAKREARLSAQAIEERFAAAHLFGDDDDHAFTPSRWY